MIDLSIDRWRQEAAAVDNALIEVHAMHRAHWLGRAPLRAALVVLRDAVNAWIEAIDDAERRFPSPKRSA